MLERTTLCGSRWNSAARAKILASQHFASLHRTILPLHNIFFQNNSFFMGNRMDTGRQEQYQVIYQRKAQKVVIIIIMLTRT